MKFLSLIFLFTLSLEAFAEPKRCPIEINNESGGMTYLDEEDEKKVEAKVREILDRKGYIETTSDQRNPAVLEYSVGFGGCSQAFYGEYMVNFSGRRNVEVEWSDGIDLTEPTTDEDFDRIVTSTFDGFDNTLESIPNCPGF